MAIVGAPHRPCRPPVACVAPKRLAPTFADISQRDDTPATTLRSSPESPSRLRSVRAMAANCGTHSWRHLGPQAMGPLMQRDRRCRAEWLGLEASRRSPQTPCREGRGQRSQRARHHPNRRGSEASRLTGFRSHGSKSPRPRTSRDTASKLRFPESPTPTGNTLIVSEVRFSIVTGTMNMLCIGFTRDTSIRSGRHSSRPFKSRRVHRNVASWDCSPGSGEWPAGRWRFDR